MKRWEIINGAKLTSPDEVLDILLKNRDISDKDTFFNSPSPREVLDNLGEFFSDLNLKHLDKAVGRIGKAMARGEKIIVWGDYDVDGISSTALLWRALFNLGANVMPHIPDRFEEGYGLNKPKIEEFKKEGVSLIITVDSGITAKGEIELANRLGVDVVVTDHHLKPKSLPPAYSIVHTTRLCGTGIAWILASQFIKREEEIEEALDLVAIATVADLQPLTGANRALARRGFEVLSQLRRPGLAALAQTSGLRRGNLGSYEASWILGPRINAVGRMQHGIEALRLLCTKNPTRARELAGLLDSANSKRRSLTEDIFNHAKELVEEDGRGLIVVHHEDWHEGVIGLVAGRLVEEYGRPAVVIAKNGGFSKGSARSVTGLDIVDLLRGSERLLEDVGGHEQAAGFTVKTSNLESFIREVVEKSKEKILNLNPQPILKVDLELPLSLLDYELVYALEEFKPFGVDNPEPVFAARDISVISQRKVGRTKKHLKLSVASGFEAIWFGGGERGEFSRGDTVSFAYTPQINRWRGREKVSLKIRDLKQK